MNRYHSPRRTSSAPAGPIVAFLLIACFGLLFVTGCSSTVSGPEEQTEDDTFTAEDVARFRALSEQNDTTSSESGMAASAAALSASSMAPDSMRIASEPTVTPATVDPALRKSYDALRATSTGKGGNIYRVTNTFLNVRGTASVSGPFVAKLNQGDLVSLMEFVNGSWAKISLSGGQTGYVANRYLSKLTTEERLKDEQKAFDGQYFVNFAFVNVRTAPDSGSEKIGEIPGQAFVRPLSMDGDWARVPLEGKEGYVSTQYLSPFRPNFLVRQDRFTLPILHYDVRDDATITALTQHAARLKQDGVKVLTFRDFFTTLQTQEVRDVRLSPRSVILAISGITAQNVKRVSDALTAAGVPATFFVQTDQVGISGLSEKALLTLQANGFDIQSAGHTGDDLRTLTDAQTRLEMEQSRTILETLTHKTVFAIAYPQGGANDRVLTAAADGGYLFGMGSAPDKAFSRDQFLRLPSYQVTSGMTADDVLKLTK